MIVIELLTNGLKQNFSQIRTVTGIFRQAWLRPAVSAIVNLVVSIILVQVIGVYGVIIETIFSDIVVTLSIDPKVIHKYRFNDYKPVSEYYRKNLVYVSVLCGTGAFDMWICSWLLTGYGWFSLLLHMLIVMITVPAGLIVLFWNSQECQYLKRIVFNVLHKVFRRRENRA